MYDESVKRRFVQLRALGYSYIRIKGVLQKEAPEGERGPGRTTLLKWGDDIELQSDIRRLKTAAFEELLDEYEVGKRHRVERLAQRLKKLDEVTADIDLRKASIATLLKEYRLYLEAIREEAEPGEVATIMELYEQIMVKVAFVDQKQTKTGPTD